MKVMATLKSLNCYSNTFLSANGVTTSWVHQCGGTCPAAKAKR